MKFKIGYLDDEMSNVRQFQRSTRDDFDVIPLVVADDLKELINNIILSQVKAIVVDYKLKTTKPNIDYSGVDVVRALDDELKDFPSFLLTGFETDAETQLVDVNKIYCRNEYFNAPEKLNRRIRRQIENYIKEIEEIEKEYLLLKKHETLTLEQEERLIELDDFLEKRLRNRSRVPKTIKKISNTDKLNDLINLAKGILEEVKEL